MTRKSRTTISLEGWYYLLLLAMVCVGAVVGGVNLLLVLAGMLAGPLLFGWWAVRGALRGIEPRRKLPHGVCAGDLLVVNVRLTNTRRRRGCWAVVVEEQIRREGFPADTLRPRVLFSYVPAGESRDAAYRGRLERRGRYRLGPPRLSTRFPFGLFCQTTTVGGTDTLTVFPRLGRLTQAWAARHHEALTGTQRRERRHGNEGDFYGVRQWRSGDKLPYELLRADLHSLPVDVVVQVNTEWEYLDPQLLRDCRFDVGCAVGNNSDFRHVFLSPIAPAVRQRELQVDHPGSDSLSH